MAQKPGKAPGLDGIPADLYRSDLDMWVRYVNNVSNAVLASGTYPHSWNGAIIVPIYKKGNRAAPMNYRPISLPDNLPKIFCH
ncbi:hypothetical protein NDU88_006970, partial [Pleurodeles waltl]